MPAFVLCDVVVKDESALESYIKKASPTVSLYGGQFLVQGGEVNVFEGDWSPSVVIVARFPSMATAKAWYGSREYGQALALKDRALTRQMILVEGLDQAV